VSDLRTYLSETAQRELDALRAALDARLMALEKALAHPENSESLETLIIDLARVASEEAHTSAARQWLEAQADADARTPRVAAGDGAGIHGALIEESASLRREVEELRTRLERETERGDGVRRDVEAAQEALQAERATRSRLDSELIQARTTGTDLSEAVETLRGDLDVARKTVTDAQRELYSVRQQLQAALDSAASGAADLDANRTSVASLSADVARERAEREALAADVEQARADTAAAVADADAARAALTALEGRYRELERTATAEREERRSHLSAVEQRVTDVIARAEAADAAVRAETAKLRQAEAALTADRERFAANEQQLRAELERARAEQAEYFAEYEKADVALKTATAEMQTLRADLEAAREHSAAAAHAEIESLRSANGRLSAELESLRAAHQALSSEGEAMRTANEELEGLRALNAAATGRVRELELRLFRREQADTDSPDVELGSMLEDRTPTGEQPIRRYSRYSFRSKIDVDIEGANAQLIDLSVGGAQVLSATPLELHHECPIALISDEIPVSCRGTVVWTRADPQSQAKALRYRAGIQFTDSDPAAVEAFIIRYSST